MCAQSWLRSYGSLSTVPGGLWSIVEAYRSGLMGKAAAWAEKKQKQHRAVSERAMVAMENINT